MSNMRQCSSLFLRMILEDISITQTCIYSAFGAGSFARSRCGPSHLKESSMASATNARIQYENRILGRLPRSELNLFQHHLEPIDLPVKMFLQEAGRASEYAYFPETGIASMVSTLRNGATV